MHAIDRNRQKRPLFGVDLPEQVSGPKPPTPGVATATGPTPPKPAESALATPTQPRPPDSSGSATAATAPVAPPVPVKPLPNGFRAKPDAPLHASGWPTRIICERDGAEMVLVPGATFLMGRDDGDPDERPAHRVGLSTYYIDLHEVTVRQYLLFLKETGRPIDVAKLTSRETTDPPTTGEHPVVSVNAREAKAFCNWSGRRLPTEAQWEMAARSPEGRISYWNGELPRKDPPKGPRPMEPVMSLPSDLSPCGAFDMGANAWEWTSEYYDSQYYQQFRNPINDPTGPKESRSKPAQVTVKGGSKSGILTWREGHKIETRLPYLGFRGALSVEGTPAAPASAPQPNNGSNLPGGVVPF
jgi:sulfatase modifying factor 1